MESKVALKQKPIYKVNMFYALTLIWAIVVQFFPIPENLYQYVAFLIPISIYLIKNKKDAKRILKLNPLNKESLILIPVIWLFMIPLSIFIITIYTNFFGDTLADIVTQETSKSNLGVFLFTAVTPAFVEEIFMRGIILDGYRNKSLFTAAIINGLMFGMLHLNTFQFSHTFFAGILASYLVYSTNSIFSSMLIHFINNGFPLFMDLALPASTIETQGAGNMNLFLFGLAVFLCLIVVYLLVNRLAAINNINLKEKRQISDEKIFNKPLNISILIFIIFSLLLALTLKK